MIRVISGLPLQANSPSNYVYHHGEGQVQLKFYGMIKDALGKPKADWRITTAKGMSARGYRSLQEAAEQLAVSVWNRGSRNG